MTAIDPGLIESVSIDLGNVDATSFFCLQSSPRSAGYLGKRAWLEHRYAEGLKIHMLGRRNQKRWTGQRGFIEYIPGEYAWRAIDAAGYLVIHCLWVVGQSRSRGGARKLMDRCLEDARAGDYAGVATVAAENGFTTGRGFYEHAGFSTVAQTDARMSLMMYQLDAGAPPPTFSLGAQRGPAAYPDGLTVLRADQCPYIEDATATIVAQAEAIGITPITVIEFESAQEVRDKSPTPYGVFGVVLDGQLLSYRYLTPKEFASAVTRVRG